MTDFAIVRWNADVCFSLYPTIQGVVSQSFTSKDFSVLIVLFWDVTPIIVSFVLDSDILSLTVHVVLCNICF